MSSLITARIYVGLTASLFAALSCEKTNKAPHGYGPVTHAIISEFHKHALIALGENHDREQDQDLRLHVIRSPEFQALVRNIVVECGNALYQRTLDRYIAGEPVSEWKSSIFGATPFHLLLAPELCRRPANRSCLKCGS